MLQMYQRDRLWQILFCLEMLECTSFSCSFILLEYKSVLAATSQITASYSMSCRSYSKFWWCQGISKMLEYSIVIQSRRILEFTAFPSGARLRLFEIHSILFQKMPLETTAFWYSCNRKVGWILQRCRVPRGIGFPATSMTQPENWGIWRTPGKAGALQGRRQLHENVDQNHFSIARTQVM